MKAPFPSLHSNQPAGSHNNWIRPILLQRQGIFSNLTPSYITFRLLCARVPLGCLCYLWVVCTIFQEEQMLSRLLFKMGKQFLSRQETCQLYSSNRKVEVTKKR